MWLDFPYDLRLGSFIEDLKVVSLHLTKNRQINQMLTKTEKKKKRKYFVEIVLR